MYELNFKFDIVVACDRSMGIGRLGQLPWYNSEDFKIFKKLTMGQGQNVVIMGLNTWRTCLKEKPLPGRLNIVLSSSFSAENFRGVVYLKDLVELNQYWLKYRGYYKDWFVIGGSNVYSQFMVMKKCRYVYVSHIEGDYECDRFFPWSHSLKECRQDDIRSLVEGFECSGFKWKCYSFSEEKDKRDAI